MPRRERKVWEQRLGLIVAGLALSLIPLWIAPLDSIRSIMIPFVFWGFAVGWGCAETFREWKEQRNA